MSPYTAQSVFGPSFRAALAACCIVAHSAYAGAEPALSLIGTNSHPLQTQIDRVLASRATVQPTGLTRKDYLKWVDGQVRALQKYQKPDGDMPDPVDGRTQFGPPCYARSVATLAASGFDTDPHLLESGMLAMDYSVNCLARGASAFRDRHPDFYTYPVMQALDQFEKLAPRKRWEGWQRELASMNPATTYARYNDMNANNWALVHTGGEFLRSIRGMTDLQYVERILQSQRRHMTPQGLYLENGAPFAYDAFSRYFLTGMLQHGLRDEFYRDACWRGAWTSLLLQSPTGEMPTTYRSAQHIWNEAELAAIYEAYASACAAEGRAAEAGAFKRGARLAMTSLKEWIRPDGSGYIVKNRFPLEARHGYESYSVHQNYNLLACSMLCTAWENADDSIVETAAPADAGGFVIHIPEFNTVVAHAAGNYVQFMTRGDGHYNPTGLLRVHLRGGHPRLGFSDGMLDKATPVSAGPVEVLEETVSQVRFRCGQTITVNADGVAVETTPPIRFPMLVDDGREKTRITLATNTLSLRLGGLGVHVTVTTPATATWQRTGKLLNHHNGKVEEAFADGTAYRITAPREAAGSDSASPSPSSVPVFSRQSAIER